MSSSSSHPPFASAALGFSEKKQLSSSPLGEAVRNWQRKESEPTLYLQVGAERVCQYHVSPGLPCIQAGRTPARYFAVVLWFWSVWASGQASPEPNCYHFQLIADFSHLRLTPVTRMYAVLVWEKGV